MSASALMPIGKRASSVHAISAATCGTAAPRRSASRERLLGPLARALEHGVEHRRGELARERVLLAGVEAAEQPPVLRAVAEAWPRARRRPVRERRDAQRRLPRERAEADDHARRPDEV